MRRSPALLFYLFILSYSCPAQYGITKASVYTKENIAGTIRVDDQGKPKNSGIFKTYLIYVETDASQPLPKWEHAWVEGGGYAIRPVEVTQDLALGNTEKEQEVRLKVRSHKRLWQLVLSPAPFFPPDSTVAKAVRDNPVVLTGRWKNKPFHFTIKKIQPLGSTFGQ
jgi:hypothetical protein